MTTLATGLPISHRAAQTKITPALRLAVQKATSVFQKDFCYDLIQSLVDDPEIADPIGVRVFLNFCLKKPDALVDSFLDSIDQNIGAPGQLAQAAETVLNELDNFLEFVHGLIEMIDCGEIFKLAYHEIDAWKLAYKILDPIQRRLFDLAVQDRRQLVDQPDQDPELTFAADEPSSGFYQAFVTIDKFLKHSFESRVLLEPAKLVEDATELTERRAELQTFRVMFPPPQTSTMTNKKWGRFGREEAAIEHFLESDKFKELSKLKAQMSGGQLTRQPSTRVKKVSKPPLVHEPEASPTHDGHSKSKRSPSPAEPTHIDPFLREPSSPTGKLAFADGSSSDSEKGESTTNGARRRKSAQPAKPVSRTDSATSSKKPSRHSLPASAPSHSHAQPASSKRKRARPPAHDESSKRKRTRRRKSSSKKTGAASDDGGDQEEEEDVFEIDKIIGESVDINGEVIYKVLWLGYPESDATWQFANSLDDCLAVDVWQAQKKNLPTTSITSPEITHQTSTNGNAAHTSQESGGDPRPEQVDGGSTTISTGETGRQKAEQVGSPAALAVVLDDDDQ